MSASQFVMREDDFLAIQEVIDPLLESARARGVFVVDRVGQLIRQTGQMGDLDTTSLASLTAGCVAATGGLAQLLGEDEFPTHVHQGERDSLHMTLVGRRGILVVVYDRHSSLGLVRLRARKASAQLATIFEAIRKKCEAEGPGNGKTFADISDDEIDNLFSD
ncbi:MAG: roadblock/LC7 domain-containing protein [Myxococcota bacterium]|nr:roadblock/LC7 domain-containing protein [Myxococcota bacterium]